MPPREALLEFWRSRRVDAKLLAAFMDIPREQFIPSSLEHHAYEDRPLPTLRGQSISQPTTVMIMLQALELKEGDKVFELGTGAGYQTALLSKIVGSSGKVVSCEIIPELVHLAKQNAAALGLSNLLIIEGDGAEGHLQEAPFDKIILTAACTTIPQPLLDQLKEGGMVIAPIGDRQQQTMVKGSKMNGRLELEFLGPFLFVPMTGKYGLMEQRAEYWPR